MERKFLIRKSCEYSLVVHAETEEEVSKIYKTAEETPLFLWDQAWSEIEVEEITDDK